MVVEIERAKQVICEKINSQAEQFLQRLDQRIEGFVLESDFCFEFLFHEFNAKFVGARPMQSFLYAQNKMKRNATKVYNTKSKSKGHLR